MLIIDDGASRFNYRVAGIAIHEGHVLVHRADFENFWTLPGGRCEMGEASDETLRREMKEEIGADVQVGGLRYCIENFFRYDNRVFHELGLYYQLIFPEDSGLTDTGKEFYGEEPGVQLIYRWHPLERLSELEFKPGLLKSELPTMREETRHLVCNEL